MLIIVVSLTIVCCTAYILSKKIKEHYEEPKLPYSVLELDNMFSDQECKSVRDYMSDKMEPSTVVNVENGGVDQQRTSSTGWLAKSDPKQQKFIKKFMALGAQLTGYADLDFYEDISIVRYRSSEYYREHYDACATPKNCNGSDRVYRKATLILYLNDGFEGGETNFPTIKKMVSPKVGKVVMFYDTDHKGIEINESLHAGMPVKRGEKWIATLWIKYLPKPEEIDFLDQQN